MPYHAVNHCHGAQSLSSNYHVSRDLYFKLEPESKIGHPSISEYKNRNLFQRPITSITRHIFTPYSNSLGHIESPNCKS